MLRPMPKFKNRQSFWFQISMETSIGMSYLHMMRVGMNEERGRGKSEEKGEGGRDEKGMKKAGMWKWVGGR
jgi:hypothetical protein